jgi:hypothetical protein
MADWVPAPTGRCSVEGCDEPGPYWQQEGVAGAVLPMHLFAVCSTHKEGGCAVVQRFPGEPDYQGDQGRAWVSFDAEGHEICSFGLEPSE